MPRKKLTTATDREAVIGVARGMIETKMREQKIPGYVAGVYANGRVQWTEGFGHANLEQRSPVLSSTRFRVGSVSKSFTAAALGRLVEEGRLDLDAPIQQYVPSFPKKRSDISTRLLAGHLAGIRHYKDDEFYSTRSYTSVTEALEVFADDPLLSAPGTAFVYSSYGWNLISAVIEGASGENFLDYMDRTVFRPLNMNHTVPDKVDSIIPERTSYYNLDDVGRVRNAPYVDNSVKWAGGGFLSSVEDLLKFGAAHLRPGFHHAETLQLLFTSQKTINGAETGYGLGWRTACEQDTGRWHVWHTGGSVGGKTALVLYPDEGVAVAVVANMLQVEGQLETAVALANLFSTTSPLPGHATM